MKIPRPFQVEAIESIAHQNTLLNDECGLGKTIEALEGVRHFLLKHPNPTRMGPHLVICLKTARFQWYLETVSQMNGFLKVCILDTDGHFKDGELKKVPYEVSGADFPGIIITHYENILKWYPSLKDVPWLTITADEAHKIKNRNAKRSLRLKVFKAERKIAATATPMDKRPSDYWSILNWLYPKRFKSFWNFQKKYEEFAEVTRWNPYPKFIGPQDLDDLAREVGPFTFARTKSEVAPELPPKILQRIPLDMETQQRELYSKIATTKDIEVLLSDFEASYVGDNPDVDIIIPNVLARIIRLQQVSCDPRLLDFQIPSSKLIWLDDWFKANPEQKVVIFSKFRATAQKLANMYKAPLIVGGVKNPTMAAAPFLLGESDKIFGTIDAMGVSLDGLQRASTAIFLDQTWSSLMMQQATDRIHRMNITEPKHIIYLHNQRTVDDLVLDALDQKWTDKELVRTFVKEWQS